MERGLLDLNIEVSTKDIRTGKDFSLMLLIKNPFEKPVWIREVNLILPGDFKLGGHDKLMDRAFQFKNKQEKDIKKFRIEKKSLSEDISSLKGQISSLGDCFKENNADIARIKHLFEAIEYETGHIQDKLQAFRFNSDDHKVNGVFFSGLKLNSNAANVYFDNADKDSGDMDLSESNEPWLSYEGQNQAKKIALRGTIPQNVALQPGSTAIYSTTIKSDYAFIFSTLSFKLQLTVNYRFNQLPPSFTPHDGEEGLYTSTLSHHINLRPSTFSIVFGASVGGFFGALLRVLQSGSEPILRDFQFFTIISSLSVFTLAIVMSSMATVFMVRKSDEQSFIAVEDFWGGLLIGSLIGFVGTTLFI